MEVLIAVVLATLFVLLTVAFHLPRRLLGGRRRAGRRIAWDLPREDGR